MARERAIFPSLSTLRPEWPARAQLSVLVQFHKGGGKAPREHFAAHPAKQPCHEDAFDAAKAGVVPCEAGAARYLFKVVGDDEPQIAANAILGLWRVQFGSMARNATAGRPSFEVRDAVIAEVRRAAQLIDTGLSSLALRALK